MGVTKDASGTPTSTTTVEETLAERDNDLSSRQGSEDAVYHPHDSEPSLNDEEQQQAEKHLRRKIDLRLCTIAGILCSLNLLDSGIISSASVTSMFSDLDLYGTRYSVSIFIFTVASICFSLPATTLMRLIGPRIFFSCTTVLFGIITIGTAFITTWRQMIAMRVLLGISMSGIYPGLTYLISTWYRRGEQQLRYAFLQSGEVFILATGGIVNYGLNHLDREHSLRGWQWMYLVQGTITTFLGLITYFWMIDFPENSQSSFRFITPSETQLAVDRINHDRQDAGHIATTKPSHKPALSNSPFTIHALLTPFLDPKLYAFSILFFLLNLVSTALSYFLPIILQSGFGFSTNKTIILSSPPYYYSIIPVLLTSLLSDHLRLRAPIIAFNSLCIIIGFCMFGFTSNTPARYIGTFLATGAYISNWAALSAYTQNNIVGQSKRATFAAAISACNGLGGIAGSFIVRQNEAPRYVTAVWTSIGSQILVCVLVSGVSVGFWWANGQQKRRGRVLEGTQGWRYTY